MNETALQLKMSNFKLTYEGGAIERHNAEIDRLFSAMANREIISHDGVLFYVKGWTYDASPRVEFEFTQAVA